MIHNFRGDDQNNLTVIGNTALASHSILTPNLNHNCAFGLKSNVEEKEKEGGGMTRWDWKGVKTGKGDRVRELWD